MISLESDEITALWPNDSLSFTFSETFSNSIRNWSMSVKKFFDLMISLESDEMTSFWPGDIWIFPIYDTFSYCIPNWTTFVKEVFWFDD